MGFKYGGRLTYAVKKVIFIVFWTVKRFLPKFRRFTKKLLISVLRKNVFGIRANDLLPISTIYFCAFRNSEAIVLTPLKIRLLK